MKFMPNNREIQRLTENISEEKTYGVHPGFKKKRAKKKETKLAEAVVNEELVERYLVHLARKSERHGNIQPQECEWDRFAENLGRAVASEHDISRKHAAAESVFDAFVAYLKLQAVNIGEKNDAGEQQEKNKEEAADAENVQGVDKSGKEKQKKNEKKGGRRESARASQAWVFKPKERMRVMQAVNPDKINAMRYKPMCTTDLDGAFRVLADKVIIKKRIGGDSINGEAFVACLAKCEGKRNADGQCLNMECDTGSGLPNIAVKVAPLSERELRHINNPLAPEALKRTTYAEMLANLLCHYVVTQNICPNLPLVYDVYHCKNCKFENKKLLDRPWKSTYPHRYAKLAQSSTLIRGKKDKLTFGDVQSSPVAKKEGLSMDCVFILNEFANAGSTNQFLEKYKRHTEATWFSFLFQYLAGLAAVQKWFHMLHYDTHLGNFLVHSAPSMKKTYFKYTLDGFTYYVPTSGYLFVVWDFGLCAIPGLVTNDAYASFRAQIANDFPNPYAFDVARPMMVLLDAKGEDAKIYVEGRKNLPQSVLPFMQRIRDNKTMNAQEMLASLFKTKFSKPPKGMTLAGEYNLDRRPELPSELQRFVATKKLKSFVGKMTQFPF